MQIGYKLASEAFGPAELIRQAVLAEQAGFDFAEMRAGERLNEHVVGLGFPSERVRRERFREAASGPAHAEVPLAWAPDEDTAARAVLAKTRFALTGWKVTAELPNPVNFAAATASITTEQAKAQFACGPDADRHLEVARQFADAGFDLPVAMNAGPDPDGFMDFFARELAEPLRALQPGGGGVRDQG
jgi:hypothetical protein